MTTSIPHRWPKLRAAGMRPETASQMIKEELGLDGNPPRRLAGDVANQVDPWVARLYADTVGRDLADPDDFPVGVTIEERCWQMLADLWHADPTEAVGTSTAGPTEACMLAGLALQRRWQQARWATAASPGQPNLVLSSAARLSWDKFCTYWDVECRYVPISLDHPVLDGHDLDGYIDGNTIGVVATLGVAQTGRYEPVQRVAGALDRIEARTGLDVAVHVDGTSGALIAPFLQPDLRWDFRIGRVASISTSGSHHGLANPGVGWVVWRSAEHVPSELIFYVGDRGAQRPTYTLNCTRSAGPVLQQYYEFLQLGRAGFTARHNASRQVARHLAAGVAGLPALALCSAAADSPVVAWRRRGGYSRWSLYDLRERLNQRGWRVPTAPLPDDLTTVTVQHVGVRAGLSHELADRLLADLTAAVAELAAGDSPPAGTRGATRGRWPAYRLTKGNENEQERNPDSESTAGAVVAPTGTARSVW